LWSRATRVSHRRDYDALGTVAGLVDHAIKLALRNSRQCAWNFVLRTLSSNDSLR
jgi:hypothetical protein